MSRMHPTNPGARNPVSLRAAALAAAMVIGGCTLFVQPTPTPTPAPSSTPSATPTIEATSSASVSSPSPTPEPPLSLDDSGARDPRPVRIDVAFALPPDGNGRITVTLANLSDQRINEVVLRWPTALRETLILAPFIPSDERIADGGPPLIQDWTKWVEGPGERGEPAGTTSLGYGPMDPGMTLPVELFVTRTAAGPVAFDLQVLAGEALLSLESGVPAELRVEAP
jgi:hypothetical protein